MTDSCHEKASCSIVSKYNSTKTTYTVDICKRIRDQWLIPSETCVQGILNWIFVLMNTATLQLRLREGTPDRKTFRCGLSLQQGNFGITTLRTKSG